MTTILLAKRKSHAKLTDATRLAILKMDEEQENNAKKYKRSAIACLFGVSTGAISKIVKKKNQIITNGASNTIRHRAGILGNHVERALVQRIVDVNHNGGIVTGPLVESWAQELAQGTHLDFKASRGWRNGFMRRHDLQYLLLHREAASVPEHVVAEGRAAMCAVTTGWLYEDIYNCDETGLYFQVLGSRSITKNSQAGSKLSKARMTVLACTNATGNVKLPLLVINKHDTPRSLSGINKANLPVQWRSQHKAWMTQELFCEWLQGWDATLQRPTLLLVDNCSVHNVSQEFLDGLAHVTLRFLPRNTTSHLQPLNQGILSAFKRRYRSGLVKWFADTLSNIKDTEQNGVIVSTSDKAKVFKVREKDAIKLMVLAWNGISSSTIANCWTKAAILPHMMDMDPISSGVQENVREDNLDYPSAGEEATIPALLMLRNSLADLPEQLQLAVQNGTDDLKTVLGEMSCELQVIELLTDVDWIARTRAAMRLLPHDYDLIKEDIRSLPITCGKEDIRLLPITCLKEDIRPLPIRCELPTIHDALAGINAVLGFAQRPGMLTGQRLQDAKTIKAVLEQLKVAIAQ